MTEKQIAEFCSFHEAYVSRYIQQADVKSGAVFAASAGVIGYLLSKDQFVAALRWDGTSWEGMLAWATFGLLGTAASVAFWVIAPRRAKSGGDLVFWKSVASVPSGDGYWQLLDSASLGEITGNRASHCYDLSKVCSRKYDALVKAMWLGAVAIGLSAASMLLIPPRPALPITQFPLVVIQRPVAASPAETGTRSNLAGMAQTGEAKQAPPVPPAMIGGQSVPGPAPDR